MVILNSCSHRSDRPLLFPAWLVISSTSAKASTQQHLDAPSVHHHPQSPLHPHHITISSHASFLNIHNNSHVALNHNVISLISLPALSLNSSRHRLSGGRSNTASPALYSMRRRSVSEETSLSGHIALFVVVSGRAEFVNGKSKCNCKCNLNAALWCQTLANKSAG